MFAHIGIGNKKKAINLYCIYQIVAQMKYCELKNIGLICLYINILLDDVHASGPDAVGWLAGETK